MARNSDVRKRTMNNTYDEYERKCKAIRETNTGLLRDFRKWLEAKSLGAKTVKRHVSNIDFYISEFLCCDDPPQTAAEGIDGVNFFLGYWFIRKAMWAGPTSIRENATSLKKFYAYMVENELVQKDDFEALGNEIKDGLPEWIATVNRYDDPDVDIEDIW